MNVLITIYDNNYIIYLEFFSDKNLTERLQSKNSSFTSSTSSLLIVVRPLTLQFWYAGVKS